MTLGIDEYIKANKKLAREEELQRNGGRWVAKDRPTRTSKSLTEKETRRTSILTCLFYSSNNREKHTPANNYLTTKLS